MLDKSTITQLSQLKKDIIASKEYAEGVVVGANGRFGFVKLPDGRSAFLNPEKMQRVLPGDRVKVSLTKNDKDQLEADLESVTSSDLTRFVATYKTKGNNHFVLPDIQQFNRWLFLPPQQRAKCREDDIVLAELVRHPFKDGRASAKVVTRIGAPKDDFLQHSLVIAKHGLAREWSRDTLQQTQHIADTLAFSDREDFSHVPFVTIDSAATKDMDDAVFAETRPTGGWQLWVAIADPGSFIAPDSPIAKAAQEFGQSVYMPGRALPMLPEQLATHTFSLIPDCERAVLMCKIEVGDDGKLGNAIFSQARIRSRHKLSYQEVSQFLAGEDAALSSNDQSVRDSLHELHRLAQARLSYRQGHNLVADEQPDFDFILNKHGMIDSIQKRERNTAHRLIEEAMLATNISAGEFLAKHQGGLFSTHQGFRPERLGEVRAVLREDLGDETINLETINEFDQYVELTRFLRDSEQHRHLLAPLKRMMQNAELNTTAAPHMSMGFQHYATITSPIRRYADLSNQWSVAQILQQQDPKPVPEDVVEQLRTTISNNRAASRQLEQTLVGHYLLNRIGLQGIGHIRIVTQQGFGVRLADSGIEGFVQVTKKMEKSFDAKRMTLTVAGTRYALNDEVNVKITAVDLEKRRIKMEPVGGFATPSVEAPPEAARMDQNANAT